MLTNTTKCSKQHSNSNIFSNCKICNERLLLTINQRFHQYKVNSILSNTLFNEKNFHEGSVIAVAKNLEDQKNYLIKEKPVIDSYKCDSNFEANILNSLSHPAIPIVYDYFQENGKSYLITDYFPHENLFNHIKLSGAFSLKDSWDILKQILEIIVYLQSQDKPVIHADIKPHNMIYFNQKIYLIDFDKSCFYNEPETLSRGFTRGYAPYEQNIQVNLTTDLYSSVASFIHMITGLSPFLWINKPSHLRNEWTGYCNIPDKLSSILSKVLSDNVQNRPFKNAQEFVDFMKSYPLNDFDEPQNSTSIHFYQIEFCSSEKELATLAQKILKKPLNAPFLYQIADRLLDLQSYTLAQTYGHLLSQYQAWFNESQLILAECHYYLGDFQNSLRLLNELQSSTPMSFFQHYLCMSLKAKNHVKSGNKMQAIKDLQQIPYEDLMCREWFQLAKLNFETGHVMKAIQYCRYLIKKEPVYKPGYLLLSKIYTSLWRFDLGIEYLEQCIYMTKPEETDRKTALHHEAIIIGVKGLKLGFKPWIIQYLYHHLKVLNYHELIHILEKYTQTILPYDELLKHQPLPAEPTSQIPAKIGNLFSIFEASLHQKVIIGLIVLDGDEDSISQIVNHFQQQNFIWYVFCSSESLTNVKNKLPNHLNVNLIDLPQDAHPDDIYNLLIKHADNNWCYVIYSNEMLSQESYAHLQNFLKYKPDILSVYWIQSSDEKSVLRIFPGHPNLKFINKKAFGIYPTTTIPVQNILLKHISISKK